MMPFTRSCTHSRSGRDKPEGAAGRRQVAGASDRLPNHIGDLTVRQEEPEGRVGRFRVREDDLLLEQPEDFGREFAHTVSGAALRQQFHFLGTKPHGQMGSTCVVRYQVSHINPALHAIATVASAMAHPLPRRCSRHAQ